MAHRLRSGLVIKKLGLLRSIQEETARDISYSILGTSSKKELQSALEDSVQSRIYRAQTKLRKALKSAVKSLEQAAEAQHRAFHAHFQELYRNLATLGGRVRAEVYGLDSSSAESFAHAAQGTTREVSGDIANLRNEEMWKGAGGVAGGAAIGTIVMPGIGTLIGGLLGGLMTLLFGRSFEEVQQECLEKVEAAVEEGFEEFDQQADENLPEIAEEIETALVTVIGNYASQYDQLVKTMIARDEQEAAELVEFQKAIHQDLTEIKARKDHLLQARTHLRTL